MDWSALKVFLLAVYTLAWLTAFYQLFRRSPALRMLSCLPSNLRVCRARDRFRHRQCPASRHDPRISHSLELLPDTSSGSNTLFSARPAPEPSPHGGFPHR